MRSVTMSEETSTTKIASELSNKKEKKSHFYTAIAVLGFLFLLAAGVAGYFYYQLKNTDGQKDPNEAVDILKIIEKVIELPEGEAPTLATVTDREKLAAQPFFKRAENGDKILIYSESGQVILYRPSTKKIIDVTTVNVTDEKAPGVPSPETTPAVEPIVPETEGVTSPQEVVDAASLSATVALYNGSAKAGVTNTLETQLNGQFPLLTVALKEKAVKSDYMGNLVVDLSGKNTDLAQKLADSFGGTVGTLPVGEIAPTADILIIVGNK